MENACLTKRVVPIIKLFFNTKDRFMKSKMIILLFLFPFNFQNYAGAETNGMPRNTGITGCVMYVSPDNNTMIFNLFPQGKEKNLDNIFITNLDSNNKTWSAPQKINFDNDAVMQSKQHGGIAKEILLTMCDKHGKSDIYSCLFVDGKYSTPVKLSPAINSKCVEKNACLSEDGSTMYFASNRKGGYGGYDIYKSERLESGDWGLIQNVGPVINTSSDEDTPFVLSDDVTLYFSSNGHNSIGGFDIFNSTLNEEGIWSEAESAGYRINSKGNDLFYYLSSDEKMIFYSSSSSEQQDDNLKIFEIINMQYDWTDKN